MRTVSCRPSRYSVCPARDRRAMNEFFEHRARLSVRLMDLAGHLATLAEPVWPTDSAHGVISLALEIGSAAQAADVRGLPELCRLLATGLRDRAGRVPEQPETDVLVLLDWCVLAANYAEGQLPADRVTDLIDGLTTIDWIPEMIPRMRELLLARVHADVASSAAARAGFPAKAVVDGPGVDGVDDVDGAESFLVEAMLPVAASGFEPEPEATSASTLFRETAFASAFDDSGSGTSNNAPASDQGPPSIWISTEEFELAATAIANQMLPSLESMASNTDPERHAALVEDYHYQAGLVVNALGLIGLDQLQSSATTALAEIAILGQLDPKSAATGNSLLANWQTVLLAWFQTHGDAAMTEALIETMRDPGWAAPPDNAALAALRRELESVRVGIDPDLPEAPKAEVSPDDVRLETAPDVLPKVLDAMLAELPGNAARLREHLAALGTSGAPADIDDARRVAHTLKGDANTVGIRGIANLTHALEDILVALARSPGIPAPDVRDLLAHAGDCVEAMADHVLGRGPVPDDAFDVYERVHALAHGVGIGARDLRESDSDALAVVSRAPTTAAVPASGVSVPTLPIAVPLLDELLRLSSETIVLARQVEEHLRQVSGEHGNLAKQNQFSRTLVGQLDDLVSLRGAALKSARLEASNDIDSLELDQYNELHVVSRRLIETSTDSNTHLMNLDHALVGLWDLAAQQDRVHLELQQSVLNTRMVPVSQVTPRFQRVVRQTARTLDRPVDLSVRGESTLVDSEILDRMTEPLVHALRNAVDHGIESPDRRLACGKPETGHIELAVSRQAGDIRFVLKDDGGGLNLEAIRRTAIERGLIAENAVLDADTTARLILLPGFSTRSEASQVSGRGIGMDVVHRRVQELRGRLTLRTQPGVGTELDIVLPASLNSAHVALARTSDGVIAIVTGSILGFESLRPEQFVFGETGELSVYVDGVPMPAVTLDQIGGAGTGRDVLDEVSIGLRVADGAQGERIIVTRRIDDMRDVIIKGLGPYFGAVPGLRGTTILGNGGLAPVIDLAQIIEAEGVTRFQGRMSLVPDSVLQRIVIADDSLSVRRALQGLLEDAGYEIDAASDGLEALEMIGSGRPPSCLLLDLEMPRMNGLELSKYVRGTEALRHIPIIMITSRTSEKHQQLADEAGVTELLGKPYNEDQLVQLVRRLIAAA